MPKFQHWICFFFILVHTTATAQGGEVGAVMRKLRNDSRPANRNVLWFTPTRAKQINGLALGSFTSSLFYQNDSLQVNGVLLEANPVTVVGAPYMLMISIVSAFRHDSIGFFTTGYPDSNRDGATNAVNGLNLSLLGTSLNTTYQGLSISSLFTFAHEVKGLSLTAGMHYIYDFRGVLIAGVINNVNRGKGLQMALINRCDDCKGVQIGLINKMGKRTLPFLNMRW